MSTPPMKPDDHDEGDHTEGSFVRDDTANMVVPPSPQGNSLREQLTSMSSIKWGGSARGLSMNEEAVQAMEATKQRLQMKRAQHQQQRSGDRLTLDGLLEGVNQYEHEATTSILKSWDEKTKQNKTVAFDAGSVIPGLSQDDGESIAAPSHYSSIDGKESVRDDTSTSRLTSDSRPLLSPTKKHRRNMSVEDQLAGLSFHMLHMGHHHGAEQPVASEEEEQGHEGFTKDMHRVLGNFSKSHRRLFSNGGRSLSRVMEENTTEESEEEDEQGQGTGDTSERSRKNTAPDIESQNPVLSDIAPPKQRKDRFFKAFGGAADRLKDDMDAWNSVFRPRKNQTLRYLIKAFLYVILPLMGVAALLFYKFDNPPTGKATDESAGDDASASWYLLFVVRQVITFILAILLQMLVIDLLCLSTRVLPKLLGPAITLFIVQSKGWPFVVGAWALLDFGLLYGNLPFAAHWGYWQHWIELFNETNPSGTVVNSEYNRIILTIAVTVPVAATMKRFGVGLFLGRQTYMHYSEPLAKVMHKMVLVSQVAALSRKGRNSADQVSKIADRARSITASVANEDLAQKPSGDSEAVFDRDPVTGSIHDSERFKLMQLLDRWEEPERISKKQKSATISAVLKFRNALTLIRNDYPFSYSFGPASSREECVDSSQSVYGRLQHLSPPLGIVTFETLALVALNADGIMDEEKAKDLVRVFRPNRDGSLSMVDFVKSVDAVYKEFRLLQASMDNSSQIDRAFESILNSGFYTLVVVVIAAAVGLDPLALFLSMSSIILAFAFVIGSASSKYFEGLLFILVRRPYGIGDLINVNGIESETGLMGSIGWFVQNVTLFETTITWLPTLETATVANGALASSRIVNWARSPNARFVIFLYFPIETTYETLELFRGAVEEYMKARPREWLAFNAFRVLAIHTDKGYMHLELVVQHREAWQNPGAIYDSRGNLVSYCNEVQKLLGMQYRAPPVPIDVRSESASGAILPAPSSDALSSTPADANDRGGSLDDKIRFAANNKHKLFF